MFDRALNEKEAEEKKLEKLTQQLKDLDAAISMAENPVDITNLDGMLEAIKQELFKTINEIVYVYFIDMILDCYKKMH